MAKQVLRDLDLAGGSRVTNALDAVNPQDYVTLAQHQATIEGLAWKDSVRAASTGNVNIASAPAALDGINLVSGDRVLLKDQTDPIQNGIYVFSAAASPLTRSLDASTFAELESAVVPVEEGTTGVGTTWRQTQVNGVIGTNSVVFSAFSASSPPASETTAGVAELATQAETDAGTDDARIVTPLKLTNWSGRMRKTAADVGDGSGTQFDVTHNFNTYDVEVVVFRNSGARDDVIVEVSRPSVNAVRLNFSAAPAAAAFRVVVIG